MTPGTICYTVLQGGLGHDQGKRLVLIVGQPTIHQTTRETLVLPISSVEPEFSYPLSWPVPDGMLPKKSWVLISRPRAQWLARLRDPLTHLDREQLDEILIGLRQLLADAA